jgi:hypothetical protein
MHFLLIVRKTKGTGVDQRFVFLFFSTNFIQLHYSVVQTFIFTDPVSNGSHSLNTTSHISLYWLNVCSNDFWNCNVANLQISLLYLELWTAYKSNLTMIITIRNDKSWHSLPKHTKKINLSFCETEEKFRVDL